VKRVVRNCGCGLWNCGIVVVSGRDRHKPADLLWFCLCRRGNWYQVFRLTRIGYSAALPQLHDRHIVDDLI
jgi:hypothetical protein